MSLDLFLKPTLLSNLAFMIGEKAKPKESIVNSEFNFGGWVEFGGLFRVPLRS